MVLGFRDFGISRFCDFMIPGFLDSGISAFRDFVVSRLLVVAISSFQDCWAGEDYGLGTAKTNQTPTGKFHPKLNNYGRVSEFDISSGLGIDIVRGIWDLHFESI